MPRWRAASPRRPRARRSNVWKTSWGHASWIEASGPFTVTPEGEKFYRACRELLDRFQTVREEILEDKQKVTGTVRVAAIYSVGLHDMGGEMQKFRSLYPDTRVRLECLHPETVVRSVLGDLTDVGILSYPPADRALNVIPLRDEAMCLVCSPSHRLANAETAGTETLEQEPFVAFDRALPVRKAIDKVLRQRGVRTDIVMEFDNVESIKKAVENGVGVSILPGTTVENEVAMKTLRALPLDVRLERPIALIHPPTQGAIWCRFEVHLDVAGKLPILKKRLP